MPMTACPTCRRFYKVKKSGYYFEEGMPRGAGWAPYKLWVGDLYECEGCGAQVITGVGMEPLAEHYQKGYADTVARVGATVRIDDCPGAFNPATAESLRGATTP